MHTGHSRNRLPAARRAAGRRLAGFGGALLVALLGEARPLVAQAPVWESRFIVWPARGDDARPWRNDPRLASRFTEKGFPDDLQVLFPNPDSAGGALHEMMWVTVIGYDTRSDAFLGILSNAPEYIHAVQQGDNVAFRWDPARQWAEAIALPSGSLASGWPARSNRSGPDSTLREGIRAYRTGANGHNMPGMAACTSILTPLAAGSPTPDSGDRTFLTHFVLGRCLAEQFATTEAVRQFQAAIAAGPDSLDAQMGLLAELSVLVHTRPEELPAGSASTWEQAFLDQLDLVRRNFAADTEAMHLLDLIMAPRSAADTAALSPAELANRRRLGFAVFRWKQR